MSAGALALVLLAMVAAWVAAGRRVHGAPVPAVALETADVEAGIRPLVEAINRTNYITVSSCEGHVASRELPFVMFRAATGVPAYADLHDASRLNAILWNIYKRGDTKRCWVVTLASVGTDDYVFRLSPNCAETVIGALYARRDIRTVARWVERSLADCGPADVVSA